MPCYVMLCHAVLCCDVRCYAMLYVLYDTITYHEQDTVATLLSTHTAHIRLPDHDHQVMRMPDRAM